MTALEARAASAVRVRELRDADLDDVVRIDALHTGEPNPGYWSGVLQAFLARHDDRPRIGLAAEVGDAMVGYLLGEVRAFEFGSEPCGWVFGAGVDSGHLRKRVASQLLAECCRRFREAGVHHVRTMVRRNNVPVLSFFRASGFVAGSFVQLELDLDVLPDDDKDLSRFVDNREPVWSDE
jgi:ribosomal protein S18 acetylase RimI-like enzyme